MTRNRIASLPCLAILAASLAAGTVAIAVPDYGDTSPELQLAEFREMLSSVEAELDAAMRLLEIQEQFVAELAALYDETGDSTVSGALRNARVAVFQTRGHIADLEQLVTDLEAAIDELEAMMQPEDRNPPSIIDTPEGGSQWEGAPSIGSVSSLPTISDNSEPGVQFQSPISVSGVRDGRSARKPLGTSSASDHNSLGSARCAVDRRVTTGGTGMSN